MRNLTEQEIVSAATRGEIPWHPVSQREEVLDFLREAEGRAMEFDHIERADRISMVIGLVEEM